MPDILDSLTAALADRYTIERELGRGGMATVYLAEDVKHRRKVAIKVLRPELAASIGVDRFLREIEIAANLTHPHILPLHDSGEADGFLYYVMPYIEGESLRDRLLRERQLPIDDALALTREVASALSYAHNQGVVHRDIKPENIMLSAGEAVVADFGIARAVSMAGGATLTETGMALGTPAYMSPEQATAEEVDGRTDIYSLGCVLYEMLAGETPYLAQTPQAVIAKKLSEPTPRISVVREMVPAAVEAALTKALARNPVDRFATPEQFGEALTRPTSEHEPSEGTESGRQRTRRKRAWLGAIGAAVIVTIAAIAAVLGRGGSAATGPDLGGGSRDLEADRLYRQALALWSAQSDLERASDLLDSALDRDPDFVEAVALLSLVTSMRGFFVDLPPQEGYERARALATRALNMDSSLAESQYAGAMAAWATMDWAMADLRFAKAADLNPRFPILAGNYVSVLADLGHRDEALRMAGFDPGIQNEPWAYFFLGDLELARQTAEPAAAVRDRNGCRIRFLASALLGDTAVARETIERCGGISMGQSWSGPPDTLAAQAYLHAISGRRDEALQLLTSQHRQDLELMALVHTALGEYDQALGLLEQAMDKDFVFRLSSHPGYEPLHAYPRFHALLARMRLTCTYDGYRHTCEPLR